MGPLLHVVEEQVSIGRRGSTGSVTFQNPRGLEVVAGEPWRWLHIQSPSTIVALEEGKWKRHLEPPGITVRRRLNITCRRERIVVGRQPETLDSVGYLGRGSRLASRPCWVAFGGFWQHPSVLLNLFNPHSRRRSHKAAPNGTRTTDKLAFMVASTVE